MGLDALALYLREVVERGAAVPLLHCDPPQQMLNARAQLGLGSRGLEGELGELLRFRQLALLVENQRVLERNHRGAVWVRDFTAEIGGHRAKRSQAEHHEEDEDVGLLSPHGPGDSHGADGEREDLGKKKSALPEEADQ